MPEPSESLRSMAGTARAEAGRALGRPELFSVLVDLRRTASGFEVVKVRFGFQDLRRRLIEDRAARTGTDVGSVDLSLFMHDGHLAWRVLQEVRLSGFRTLYLEAPSGAALFEKLGPWCEGGDASEQGK